MEKAIPRKKPLLYLGGFIPPLLRNDNSNRPSICNPKIIIIAPLIILIFV
jgi:hypothetical protein